jgi:hypothetical protein
MKKKKLNLEAILKAFKENPQIPNKYGLEPENMTVEDLENMQMSFLMDILFEFSNPIKNMN